MRFQLERKYFKDNYTIGDLFVDYERGNGWEYLFNILEDKNRDLNKDGDLTDPGESKVFGKTAIPFGKYKITLVMSPAFKMMVPILHNVNGFTSIEIHPGNTDADTKGCLLPGFNTIKGEVHNSTQCFNKLMELMKYSKQTEWNIEII